MTNEFDHVEFSPIWNHRYEKWFQEVQYNGNELNAAAKREFVKITDETISDYKESTVIIPSKDVLVSFEQQSPSIYSFVETKKQENSKLPELQSLLLAKMGK